LEQADQMKSYGDKPFLKWILLTQIGALLKALPAPPSGSATVR
jgi:hypothetical protein